MAAPARVVLGANTLNRKWWVDKNTGTHDAPIWTPVAGVGDFKFVETKTFQKDSDFDSGGADSEIATAYTWSLEFKLRRKVKAADATSYDTGQESIRAACKRTTGLANVIELRWYEMNVDDDGDVIGPTSEAYRGYVAPQWAEDGGAMDALDTVSVVCKGRGAYEDITHPESADSVPTVTSITPNTGAAAGGEAAYIKGQYFTGTTDVEVGTTNVDDFVVIDDYTIAVVTPALAAGPYVVEVTNAAGASTSGPSFTYS